MSAMAHIINTVFLEVNTNSSKAAFALKDNLDGFLKHQLFPQIESYFEKQNNVLSGATLRFNKIEIDINQTGVTDLNALKNDIVAQLKKKISLAIQKAAVHTEDQNELVVCSKSKSALDTFIYFLRTGSKPWWQANIAHLFDKKGIETMTSETGFATRFHKVLAVENARDRLIKQFGDTILSLLVAPLTTKKIVAKQIAFSALANNPKLRNPFWIAVIDSYRLKSGSKVNTMLLRFKADKTIELNEYQALEDFATSLSNRPLTVVEGIEWPHKKETVSHEKEAVSHENLLEEGMYVNNAGLVLLHPFFKQFFINAKLADVNGKIIEAEMETAIHLMHYLCTKSEQQFESELVLEKFLCGYPIDRPLQRFIELSQELKDMAEEVLQSAITHWKALKNTSPDGLRTGFLQREGKLVVENNTCKLIVERKAQDILLDKISWNIHLIKMPWLDNLLFVEW